MRLCRGVGKRLREGLLCGRCGAVLCRAVPCPEPPRIYLSLPPRRAHHEATLRGNYLRQRYGRDYRRGEREQLLGVSGAPPGPPSPSVARAGERSELGQGEGKTRAPPRDGERGWRPPGGRGVVSPSRSAGSSLIAPQNQPRAWTARASKLRGALQ